MPLPDQTTTIALGKVARTYSACNVVLYSLLNRKKVQLGCIRVMWSHNLALVIRRAAMFWIDCITSE